MEEKEIKGENFTWIPFYEELADKLLFYKNNRGELLKKIITIFSYNPKQKSQFMDENGIPMDDIDPFSIFATFNKRIKDSSRSEILGEFKKEFSILADIPSDFAGIPFLDPRNPWFIDWKSKRGDNDIENLWNIYNTAIKYSQDNSIEPKLIEQFDNVLKQRNIKWNITMGLFWIRPNTFINLDLVDRNFIQKNKQLFGYQNDDELFSNSGITGINYLNLIKKVKSKLKVFGFSSFIDLSAHAYNEDSNNNNSPSTEEHSSDLTGPKIKREKLENISLNTILYGPPGTGKTYNTINYAVAIIDDKTVEEVEAENHDQLLERFNELKDKGLIEFITFHQSYGYEEFIEGIKPKISENEENNIDYEIKSGIFKKFCEEIKYKDNNDFDKFGLNEDPTVWKVSLAGTGDNPIRTDCFKNDRIRIGWDNYGPDILEDTDFTNGGKNIINAFINSMQIGDIVLSCYKEKIIDGIGVITGDYYWDDSLDKYKRVRKVKWILKNIHEDIFKLNNEKVMTLSTVYKLDIPLSEILKIVNANTDNAINVAGSNIMKKVFIIDEINRGNISKIFGELITLIEETKRKGNSEKIEIELPYSGTKFSVPNNIYILGTMNTADRSIALMDTALRRRFNFVEMMPDPSLLKDKKNVDGIDLEQLLMVMNKRIEYLYDREHTIGHAFFMKVNNLDDLKEIFLNKIIPLLQEYFYDDYKKINAVLGNNGFIKRENTLRFTDLFSKEASEEIGDFSEIDEKEIYSIASSNSEIWNDANAYKIIYEMKNDRAETDDNTPINGEVNE